MTFLDENERQNKKDRDKKEKGIVDNLREIRTLQSRRFLASIGIPTFHDSQILFCNEVENSFRLTLREHRETLASSGISALKREIYWYSRGYRSFDVDHVELIGADGAPANYHYSLNALVCMPDAPVGTPGPPISRDLLIYHNTVQAAICRKHGGDPYDDPEHRREIAQIMARKQHVPQDRRPQLIELEPRLAKLLGQPDDPTRAHLTVRELLAAGFA